MRQMGLLSNFDPKDCSFTVFNTQTGETKRCRLAAMPGGTIVPLEITPEMEQMMSDEAMAAVAAVADRAPTEEARSADRLRELEARGERGAAAGTVRVADPLTVRVEAPAPLEAMRQDLPDQLLAESDTIEDREPAGPADGDQGGLPDTTGGELEPETKEPEGAKRQPARRPAGGSSRRA